MRITLDRQPAVVHGSCGAGPAWLLVFFLAMGTSSSAVEAGTDDAPVWSGRVAVAQPVSGIEIDGDLSDWPEHLPRHRLGEAALGEEPESPGDLSASFRLAYDPERRLLLVAIEVEDDDHFVDRRATATWDSQDGSLLYFDPSCRGRAPAIQYNYYGDSQPDGEVVQARSRVVGSRRDYEWSIALDRVRTPEPISPEPGLVLGLDVVVCDYDRPREHRGQPEATANDRFTWLAWSRGRSKPRATWRRGQIVFGDQRASAEVTLEVRAADGSPVFGTSLQVVPVWPNLRHALSARTGRDGRWTMPLPAGRYRVDSSRPGLISRELEVAPGERRTVRLDVSRRTPIERPIGEGRASYSVERRYSGKWFHLIPADGFRAEPFEAIVDDRDGNLWFGTSSGLLRYDGAELTELGEESGLVGTQVQCLMVASDGALWVGSEESAHRIADGRITVISPLEGLAGGPVHAIHEQPEGCFWFGTANGLQLWQDGKIERLEPEGPLGSVHDFAAASDGSLWIASDQGLLRHRDGAFERVPAPVDQMVEVHESKAGALFVGSAYRGGYLRLPGSGEWQSLPVENRVLSIVEDAFGSVWIATPDQLARRWAEGGFDLFPRFDVGRGIGGIRSLYSDRESTIWVGTSTGISGYRQAAVRSLRAPGTTVSLATHGSDAWVGCAEGLLRCGDGGMERVGEEQWARWGQVLDTHVDRRGRLWVAAAGALVRRTDGGWEDLAGEASGVVPALCLDEDPEGRIWVGTSFGVRVFDAGDEIDVLTSADGLHADRVPCLAADRDGRIWLGTEAGLLTWFEGRLEPALPGQEVPELFGVRCLFEDSRGRVWVGASTGLWVLDGDRWTRHGPGGVVTLDEDQQGRLCFASAQQEGVTMLDGDLRQTLTQDDGLPHLFVTGLAFGSNDELWMIGARNVVSYRRHPAGPIFSSRHVDSTLHPISNGRIEVTTDQSLLALDLRAVSHRTRPEGLQYRYRLLGSDEAWQLSSDGRVELEALEEGQYVFEAQAIDSDLDLSDTVRLSIRVQPPWRRFLMGGALVLALAVLLWQAIQIVQRNRQVRRARDELEKRVADRTAELAVAYRVLLESEGRFRELVECSPFGIHQMDLTGRVLSSNPAGEALWPKDGRRYEPPEFSMAVAEADRPRVARAFARARAGRVTRFEFTTPDGRSFEGSFVPVPADAPTWLMGLSLDVSERKQMEAEKRRLGDQLHQSQKLEAIGRLTGGIVHDFNNILTALLAEADHLQGEGARGLEDPGARERLEEIRQTVLRGTALTHQLLSFTRPQDHLIRHIDLADLVRRMEGMLRRVTRRNIEIHTVVGPESAWAEIDANGLEQVLLNLTINASDAMPEGGDLEIGLRTIERTSHLAQRQGRFHLLSVRDTGPGISDEVMPRLFEPFFTTKPVGQGTGLGLSTAQSIIARSQGFLEARNHSDGGAVFEISLPVAAAPDARAAEAIPPEPSDRRGHGERILICDDDEAVRRALARALDGAGYRVSRCATGRAAIDRVRSADPPIDLALVDFILPDLDGAEVAQRLVAIRADLSILLSSGYASDVILTGQLSQRFELIQKPFPPSELLARVRALLDARREPAS